MLICDLQKNYKAYKYFKVKRNTNIMRRIMIIDTHGDRGMVTHMETDGYDGGTLLCTERTDSRLHLMRQLS